MRLCVPPRRTAAALSREAERLLRDKNGLRHSPRAPYQALTCALLAGDARSVDALGGVLQVGAGEGRGKASDST